MSDYIVSCGSAVWHFFCTPERGLYVKSKQNNIWRSEKPICPRAVNKFCVFPDSGGTLLIVCVTRENELIYYSFRKNEQHSCALTTLRKDMKIFDIKLVKHQSEMSIVYAVGVGNEIFLVHCVLGDNALPKTLDRLSAPDFFVFRKRIYYTNAAGVLGYRDLNNKNAGGFNSLVAGGVMPYLITHNGKDMITYKKGDTLFFQNRPIFDEKYAESPILVSNVSRLLLMWKKGDFVRFGELSENGFSPAVQLVNPGRSIIRYNVINNEELYYFFGYFSGKDFRIYGTDSIFPRTREPNGRKEDNEETAADSLKRLELTLEARERELAQLKNEIARLKNNPKENDGILH